MIVYHCNSEIRVEAFQPVKNIESTNEELIISTNKNKNRQDKDTKVRNSTQYPSQSTEGVNENKNDDVVNLRTRTYAEIVSNKPVQKNSEEKVKVSFFEKTNC